MASKQFVLFKLDAEEYAISIEEVNEITDIQDSSSIPESENYIDGVINLRGEVIPVISLRRIFNLEESSRGEDQKIIVAGKEKKGYIIDEATYVLTIDEDDIVSVDNIVLGTGLTMLVGAAKYENRIIQILDLNQIGLE
ncbi:MAG: chemotaxis protein CheW [Acidaminobacteraceae bacterium]